MHSMQQIWIRKEALKFSSSHMTVFPDGTKESLHGHNFQIELNITIPHYALKDMIPFHDLKSILKKICESLDEKILIAKACPFLELNSKNKKLDTQLEFTLCKKHYSLPKDEVILIETDNITTENLAKYISDEFCKNLPKAIAKKIYTLSLRVDESNGQGASFTHTLNAKLKN